ncbi:asparagine synthase (glutamine-hydrolyzing) [Candidatus Kaiserbacteria bacterium]|nr:asparagine synthase (glutamine-hydrolyzing) [Candidatus Kaiserbacteria bacterium]
MCGIAGFVGAGDERVLDAMNAALSHRGPDDCGTYHEATVGLAQTRLAIIDLSPSGHQPMKSATGRTVVSFNGEIYNYRALRESLVGEYRFVGASDTEVILALYEKHGERAFEMIDGMFAIALYDATTGEVFLVRDRMGKKPLYWTTQDGTLIFGSELKALMVHPSFNKEIDPVAASQYLAFESVPTPLSIFKGVRKLQAGYYLRYAAGQEPVEVAFWQLPKTANDLSEAEALSRLDMLLEKSVAERLVADVPLGVFLSGGIDSSTVAYYAARATGDRLKTFSIGIGFDGKDDGEVPYAQQVAASLGVEHAIERFSEKECLDLIPQVFAHLDEPLADASILPTYLLSGFARKHVTVALGGDGADELFAGYPTFEAEELARVYTHVPRLLRSGVIEPLVRSLPVSHSYLSFDFKLKTFLAGAGEDARYRHQRWMGAFAPEEGAAVLRTGFAPEQSPYAILDQYFSGTAEHGAYMNEVLWSYARTYLMDQVLVKVDRASMAHALEVRAPFLDRELVEFAFSLPYSLKHRGLTGKYLLKKLMRGKIPDAVIDRPKRGFGIPTGRWLQKELRPLTHEFLGKDALDRSGVFAWQEVERLLDEHERGLRDHRKKIWTLLAFQLWYQKWAA